MCVPACPSLARLCLHDYLVMKSSPKKKNERKEKKKKNKVQLSPLSGRLVYTRESPSLKKKIS
ncbi:hypothetical protein GHT06_013155 [Daphnia sinensis]|uniref:Uncharacterized protein n=1 Tax=Daphnia sinensis TaxID=1820382 RepID=A0AAD5LHM6_9CRUS|nr:hypothetical protein GHT06_013155 [Daphnia sinensis]